MIKDRNIFDALFKYIQHEKTIINLLDWRIAAAGCMQ